MILTSLLFLFGLVLLALTLPLAVELLVLTSAALLPGRSSAPDESQDLELPSLSVIVPAHNEEMLIGRCVESLLRPNAAGVTVHVVAHNCTDRTAAEAEAAGAQVLVLNDPDQRGKGSALSHGFAAALAGGADAVLVVDADSVVSESLLADVRRQFKAGAKALQCRYEVRNAEDSQRTRLMALAFQAFNVIRPRGRARLGLSAGIFGNGFGMRREVLERVPYGAHSVVEDLEYHLGLVRAGIRVEWVDSAAVYGDMPVSAKGASTQRARWEGGRLLMMKQWAPRLLKDVLQGKLRFTEPLLDLLGLPLAMEVSLLLLAFCLPVGWLRLYALAVLGVLALHLVAAAASKPDFWGTVKVLASAPGYVFWKLWMLPGIWRASRANAAWVRTERDSSLDTQ